MERLGRPDGFSGHIDPSPAPSQRETGRDAARWGDKEGRPALLPRAGHRERRVNPEGVRPGVPIGRGANGPGGRGGCAPRQTGGGTIRSGVAPWPGWLGRRTIGGAKAPQYRPAEMEFGIREGEAPSEPIGGPDSDGASPSHRIAVPLGCGGVFTGYPGRLFRAPQGRDSIAPGIARGGGRGRRDDPEGVAFEADAGEIACDPFGVEFRGNAPLSHPGRCPGLSNPAPAGLGTAFLDSH